MKVIKLFPSGISLVAFVESLLMSWLAASLCAGTVNAQTLAPDLRPDLRRAIVAHERTTLDSVGGSVDIAVGRSGARYEVYSATLNNKLVGVVVVALDTNGDYRIDTSSTYNLRTDFNLPSAAAVVTGTSKAGREFVIVSSSGYNNSANPNDPNNEPSPGIVL